MLECQKRAKAKYKEKVKTIRFDCFPTDQDIIDHIEAKKAAGEAVATYLKQLIREDMKRGEGKSKK